MTYPFIVVSGIIGAGKSTLCSHLYKEIGFPSKREPDKRVYPVEMYLERVEENPYLKDYYELVDLHQNTPYPRYQDDVKIKSDFACVAFEMQIHLLYSRYRQHQQIIWNLHREAAIQDRSIYEDQLFVNILEKMGILDKRAVENYRHSLEIMSVHFRLPDLIIYLDITPETGMERKEIRGRDSEKAVFLEYQTMLKAEYDKWAWDMEKRTQVEFVDWNEDNQKIEPILELIAEKMPDERR